MTGTLRCSDLFLITINHGSGFGFFYRFISHYASTMGLLVFVASFSCIIADITLRLVP